ncbi:unnamed protein product [Callosobruchus maculatus]|uniref:Uncharacterized protein n=1 Tax=Callosobruchus maculatus TaxID=64391 RepID=A0A653BM22_CALMS|nr:unnamed protein product [Callosobruchus maculatus]
MDCLLGLRYLSICWATVGHRHMQNMIYPPYNSIQLIYVWEYSTLNPHSMKPARIRHRQSLLQVQRILLN